MCKKLSLKKIEKDKLIIQKFCENKTAFEVSNELELNYKTVKDRFDVLRQKLQFILKIFITHQLKTIPNMKSLLFKREKVKKKES